MKIINTSLAAILANLPPDAENPLSISGKKIKPKYLEITIRVGFLKKDLKDWLNVDINQIQSNPSIKIDCLTVCAKENPTSKEAKIIIFLDYPALTQKDQFGPLLVVLNHEICGHLPLILKDRIPEDKNEEEFLAYKASNEVLENIIKALIKRGAPQKTIEELKKSLKEEKEMEAFYKRQINP